MEPTQQQLLCRCWNKNSFVGLYYSSAKCLFQRFVVSEEFCWFWHQWLSLQKSCWFPAEFCWKKNAAHAHYFFKSTRQSEPRNTSCFKQKKCSKMSKNSKWRNKLFLSSKVFRNTYMSICSSKTNFREKQKILILWSPHLQSRQPQNKNMC